jgi:hypothetical protein
LEHLEQLEPTSGMTQEDTSMSKASDYSPEEWQLITSAPMAAGMLVSVADMSGPIGLAKEAMAVVKAVTDTSSGSTNELIKSVAEAIKAQRGKTGLSDVRGDRASVHTALLDRCKQAAALVTQKSPAEAKDYKQWLLSLAKASAGASNEGGFLGFGGTTVSESESSTVRELASALGVQER